jgi:hypothetical protein
MNLSALRKWLDDLENQLAVGPNGERQDPQVVMWRYMEDSGPLIETHIGSIEIVVSGDSYISRDKVHGCTRIVLREL